MLDDRFRAARRARQPASGDQLLAFVRLALGAAAVLVVLGGPAPAEDKPTIAIAEPTPGPLAEDAIDALVARVALYPDPLLALVLQASTLPLQVVQAARFLDKRAKDP